MPISAIKKQLHALCQVYINDRIASAQEAMRMAQSSANDETKSSAGDKYETGRAMAQLEIEKNSAQLAEALKQRESLEKVQSDQHSMDVQAGSLVITNQGNFYISISAGKLLLAGVEYFAISQASPLGSKLMKQVSGASLIFNQKEFRILEIV